MGSRIIAIVKINENIRDINEHSSFKNLIYGTFVKLIDNIPPSKFIADITATTIIEIDSINKKTKYPLFLFKHPNKRSFNSCIYILCLFLTIFNL